MTSEARNGSRAGCIARLCHPTPFRFKKRLVGLVHMIGDTLLVHGRPPLPAPLGAGIRESSVELMRHGNDRARVIPVSSFVMVTVVPGTMALEVSTTEPTMPPNVLCPLANGPDESHRAATASTVNTPRKGNCFTLHTALADRIEFRVAADKPRNVGVKPMRIPSTDFFLLNLAIQREPAMHRKNQMEILRRKLETYSICFVSRSLKRPNPCQKGTCGNR